MQWQPIAKASWSTAKTVIQRLRILTATTPIASRTAYSRINPTFVNADGI